jgi:hypothetical protein
LKGDVVAPFHVAHPWAIDPSIVLGEALEVPRRKDGIQVPQKQKFFPFFVWRNEMEVVPDFTSRMALESIPQWRHPFSEYGPIFIYTRFVFRPRVDLDDPFELIPVVFVHFSPLFVKIF